MEIEDLVHDFPMFHEIGLSITPYFDTFSSFLVDNGTREGLDKFLKAASEEPETVLHYEFMQDYKVRFQAKFHITGVPK